MNPEQARYEPAISPIDIESDNITISSGGPPNAASNLLEPVCSPCHITSAPDLGTHLVSSAKEVSECPPF
jgi:hypothetical protein